jgi:uncharacterized protein
MSDLRERFMASLKEAMKGGDKMRVATLRLVQAGVKDKDIEARGLGKPALADDEILAVLQKMIKQREESTAIYRTNNRLDLAEQEEAEIAVLRDYMPQALSDEEVSTAVGDAIAELSATSIKDMGRVIAHLRANYAGRMDFAAVSGVVRGRLGV